MMSRKDYRKFAEYFRSTYDQYRDGKAYSEAVGEFADILAEDNPRFNRRTFVDACGAHRFHAGV